jgi:hypothetical protein
MDSIRKNRKPRWLPGQMIDQLRSSPDTGPYGYLRYLIADWIGAVSANHYAYDIKTFICKYLYVSTRSSFTGQTSGVYGLADWQTCILDGAT